VLSQPCRFLFLILVGAIAATPLSAQVATGTPPLSSSMNGAADSIDLANLNTHITVPILQKSGRGIPFTYALTYDNSVWFPVTTIGTTAWQPMPDWGWSAQTQPSAGYITYSIINEGFCNHYKWWLLYNWVYYDPLGVPHPFSTTPNVVHYSTDASCNLSMTTTASDGSGYVISVPNHYTDPSGVVQLTSSAGKVILAPILTQSGVYAYYYTGTGGNLTDQNGNQITVNGSGVFTDTLGQTALTISQNTPGPTTPTTYTYTAPSGANASYTMNYASYTVATNFGISGIVEYGATSIPLVSSIVLPDSTQYTFTYEATPSTPASGACTPISGTYATNCVTARIASVTLPTGGTITYAYSGGNNGILSDGTAATLTRTTPDGTWTYAHSESGTAWTTTMTDPKSYQTVLNFQGIYLTERQVYEGSASPGNLLKTTLNCYNGSTPTGTPATCNSATITPPILSKATYTIWPGTTTLESEAVMSYNTYGLGTEKDEYGYGAGAPGSLVRKTLVTYASLSNGIVNAPSEVLVEDGSGNVKSETLSYYDQTTTTTTSGTPQHITFTGSHGNLTTLQQFTSASASLTKTFTYFDTGNVQTATDYNLAQTAYTYGDCGNSFPTSVLEPVGSMSTSMTWSCAGGVELSSTDENGNTTYYDYTTNPHFWWPDYTKDQAGNVTNFAYTGQTSVESSMPFNGSLSTVDVLSTADSLGRPHLVQVKESPSSSTYDSTETDYDGDGYPDRITLPYAGTAGQTSSSAPCAKCLTRDALGRPTQITNSGGLAATLAYTQNDTYRTMGPAPSGENTKRRQYEYDALGRLTSVCEVTAGTSAWPGGSCAQTSAQTGYWTKYAYDANNNLTGVTQNAQGSSSVQQTRTYTYDELNRLTSETNPETGSPTGSTRTTSYTYDTDSTCGITSNGDLVKKIDPAGDVSCYAYDALHRGTSIIYSLSNPYGAAQRFFVYDSAAVNGVAMANPKSRQVEAYTATCSTCTKITDVGFSYTVRGEVSDIYQLSPHTGTYYHVNQTYWANGTPDGMGGLSGLPAITYAPDGEGRIYTASASSGQSPLLSSTAYDVASKPTQVNFGSSDNDVFTYDPNSERMTQYNFNVSTQSVVGKLVWNAMGTLQSLAITDPFDTTNNQNCAYLYDDLGRVASVSCGSTWAQTFSYDAFGNINKSGNTSFQPTYTTKPPTNQYSNIGGSTPTYDLNGNVTNDFVHTYTLDANGSPVTIDTVGVTNDALGRMVEQDRSGSYTDIVYAPSGAKLALMTGTTTLTFQKGYVPLTGGTMAVYNSSGLAYYRHSDWVGSSRFASTTSRTMYFDGAYAPFGEPYATTGTTDLSYTGMNQDTVSNLYDFPAREYGNIQGRWPATDPAGTASVDPRNPQTWNRYAYALNNPLGFIDPTGMLASPVEESGPFSVALCQLNPAPDPSKKNVVTYFSLDEAQQTSTDYVCKYSRTACQSGTPTCTGGPRFHYDRPCPIYVEVTYQVSTPSGVKTCVEMGWKPAAGQGMCN
jgi:RHS repeat-associated protein